MTAATAHSRWWLDTAIPDWLKLPTGEFDIEQWREGARIVFETLLEVESQLEGTTRAARPFDIDDAIDALLLFAATLPPGQRLVAALSIPRRWPLPVVITVAAADEERDLLEAAGARGSDAIEPPTVDYLPDKLGDGIRVTSFQLDDDGALWATVSCARRQDGVDTVVLWRTQELDLVAEFSPVLESLLGAVRIAPDTKSTDTNSPETNNTDMNGAAG